MNESTIIGAVTTTSKQSSAWMGTFGAAAAAPWYQHRRRRIVGSVIGVVIGFVASILAVSTLSSWTKWRDVVVDDDNDDKDDGFCRRTPCSTLRSGVVLTRWLI
jgi:hypothetical protein